MFKTGRFRLSKSGPIQYIVNADDFGYSSSVNQAILLAFRDGLISTATLMSNMPGFAEACELAREYGLQSRLGIHLNISEGRPLTRAIATHSRFCDKDGMFANQLPRTALRLQAEEAIVLSQELDTQMQACLKNGIQPKYIDSHHHFHTVWPISTIAIHLAKRYNISFIRLSRNIGPCISFAKRFYKKAFNSRLRFYRLARTDFFGSPDDLDWEPRSLYGRIEIMTHPVLSRKGEVMEYSTDGTRLRDIIERLGIRKEMIIY